MGASTRALVLESLIAGAFPAAAILGFRSSLWVAVIALGAHGVFDLARGTIVSKPGPAVITTATDSDTDIAAGVLALVGASAMSSRELSEWIDRQIMLRAEPPRWLLDASLAVPTDDKLHNAPQSKWRTVLETCVTAATGAGA